MMKKLQLGQRPQQQQPQLLQNQQPKIILIMYSTTASNINLHQHRSHIIPLLQQDLIITLQQPPQQPVKNQKLLTQLILKHLSFSLNILLVQLVVLMIFMIFITVTLLQQPKIHIHFLLLPNPLLFQQL